jgi:hypothetical protein
MHFAPNGSLAIFEQMVIYGRNLHLGKGTPGRDVFIGMCLPILRFVAEKPGYHRMRGLARFGYPKAIGVAENNSHFDEHRIPFVSLNACNRARQICAYRSR